MSYFRGNEPDCMYTYPSLDRRSYDDHDDIEPSYVLDITPEEREQIMESLKKLTEGWGK